MRATVHLCGAFLTALSFMAWSPVAHASELSILSTSEGLLEFYDGNFADARRYFDAAVAADSSDVAALYYRAVTLGRLGVYDQAIADLQRVLEIRPGLDQAALELGIVLIRAERSVEAIPWLTRAREVPDLEAAASFYLGVAELRLGRKANALVAFQRAERDPYFQRAARYYEGVIHYREHDFPKADAEFSEVEGADPNSGIGQEAQRFRAAIENQGGRPYTLYGSAGFEYDTNIVLAPSNDDADDALGITRQADGRAILLAGGRYVPWRSQHVELSLGYEFFQSLHFNLTEFNVQDHRPSLTLTASFAPVELGLSARYDYYRLENDSFFNQETVLPWVRYVEGSIGHTEVSYRLRRRDFFEHRFGERLDGFNNAAAVAQMFYLDGPERAAWIGYRFDRQDADHAQGDAFAYDGHQAEGGLTWLFSGPGLSTSVVYHYRHEAYDSASHGRRDEEHELVFAAERPLTKYLSVRVGYAGTFNNSNQQLFEYTRHIGTVAVDVSF